MTQEQNKLNWTFDGFCDYKSNKIPSFGHYIIRKRNALKHDLVFIGVENNNKITEIKTDITLTDAKTTAENHYQQIFEPMLPKQENKLNWRPAPEQEGSLVAHINPKNYFDISPIINSIDCTLHIRNYQDDSYTLIFQSPNIERLKIRAQEEYDRYIDITEKGKQVGKEFVENMKDSHTTQFKTGAKRGKDVAGDENLSHIPGLGKFPARFDLIPPEVLRAIAEVYGEGALKYDDNNWRKGLPESSLLNHLEAHINAYKLNGFSVEGENDLVHAIWNLMTLLYFNMMKCHDLLDITGHLHKKQEELITDDDRIPLRPNMGLPI